MKKDNVIDLADRVEQPISARLSSSRLGSFKMRLELQNAKLAVSTTLLSVVVLVTLANTSLLSRKNIETSGSRDIASVNEGDFQAGGRGIASIPTGTSDSEDSLVDRLAKHELGAKSVLGHEPTALQRLAIGYLEGNYAVQLTNGKIRELQFANLQDDPSRTPKHIEDFASFIESNRSLLPVSFSKLIKTASIKDGESLTSTFELVDHLNIPVAKVQFLTNSSGGLIAMSVSQVQAK